MTYKAFSQIVTHYIFTINLWLRKSRYYPVITGEENESTEKLIVSWYAQGHIARQWRWQILGWESQSQELFSRSGGGEIKKKKKNYSPKTATRERSVKVMIIPGTLERSLLLNSALQIICNFILQSGSLITFSNNSSLQSVLKIELINIAINIAENLKLGLQDDCNYDSNSNQVWKPK